MASTYSILRRCKTIFAPGEGRLVLLVTGLVLTLAMALLLIWTPVLVQQAELRLYDQMLAGRTVPPRSGVPVLVGVAVTIVAGEILLWWSKVRRN